MTVTADCRKRNNKCVDKFKIGKPKLIHINTAYNKLSEKLLPEHLKGRKLFEVRRKPKESHPTANKEALFITKTHSNL